MITSDNLFAEIIVPLPLEGTFSYRIPNEFIQRIKIGQRVEIEFGKSKRYAGIVKNITNTSNWTKIKDVLDILDVEPIVNIQQLNFWDWIAEYYVCTIGEIMQAALPAAFKLSSETLIVKEDINYTQQELSDEEFLILEALDIRNSLSLQDVQSILQKKSVMKLVKNLMDRKLLNITESLQSKSDIPKVSWIKLHDNLIKEEINLHNALTDIQKNANQSRLFLTYLKEKKDYSWIRKKELLNKSKTESSVVKSLLKKEILVEQLLEKYIYPETKTHHDSVSLTPQQIQSINEIKNQWETKDVCLLHGITGSGKTHIYIQLIKETINQGKQILYLLPEIALTTQLVLRLKQYFGDELLEYHSGIGISNRSAIWNASLNNHQLIVGARSSVFLPFNNLGLIIIDEEHDQSYKQSEPSPRYNARDAALVLAQDFNAKVLLGSATPSMESYYNALHEKYGLVKLNNRYGESELPSIKILPLKEAAKYNQLKGHFTLDLIEEIGKQLALKKQIIIFRNRRGYSPVVQCSNCNWEALCDQCDIHMTLHKQLNILKCHVCGKRQVNPLHCPQCLQHTLKLLGFGTEQIEEELKELFPETIIQRFDLDAARNKTSQSQILDDFQDGNIQILVGTQMLSKGLDFENVALVGVLNADQILFYPDFRAQERAFQLLTQLSGRSGRRNELGSVYIQAYNTQHQVLTEVLEHNFEKFYFREANERELFKYPPFIKIIKLEIRHRKEIVSDQAAEYMATKLKKILGKRILGPAESSISKIKGYYSKEIFIKLERNLALINKTKLLIHQTSQLMKNDKAWTSLRILIDVDPY
ncbi:MAG: primosomal protein N' [Saprospiraceae bacterium]